ncbi:MAG: prevent-host-death protein [Glaciimonas sp.]|nr:prevent-host-death protein [Glaciimonas sp.]
MKTASIPSLRVNPALWHAAESVLEEGESLSHFVEQSLRANIERRKMQRDFIVWGFAARDEARSSGAYFSSEEVLLELDEMLTQAETRTHT